MNLVEDILNIILGADSFTPLPPVNDPSIDFPLTIDNDGFVLTGYSNTIQTHTAKTGEPMQLKFKLFDSTGVEHIALYTNLRGTSSEVSDSDTYIIYEEGKPIEIVDPHGFFSNVNLAVSEEGSKYMAEYNVTFAKPMDTSDIILRTWDEKRNSGDIKIFDAFEVTGAPLPNNEDHFGLQDLGQYIIGQDGVIDIEQKKTTMLQEPIVGFEYAKSTGRLDRHDMTSLHDAIESERTKANSVSSNDFKLETRTFSVEEVKSTDTRKAPELTLSHIGHKLRDFTKTPEENTELLKQLCWQEHLKAQKIFNKLYQTNFHEN
jgi:hypothetical protein